MAEDNFNSECWRCSLGNTHRAAPLIWLGLFLIIFVAASRWGILAAFGLVGLGLVALSLLTTRGFRRSATFWLAHSVVTAVSVCLLVFAVTQS